MKKWISSFSCRTLQICGFLKDGATEVWNQAQDVPYAYKGNQWVGYDNIKSFQIKVAHKHRILVFVFISGAKSLWLWWITYRLEMPPNPQTCQSLY